MTDETNNEPTSFTIPVYADVWKTNLQDYLEGERGDLEHNVTLHVGRAPTTYNEYYDYLPVGQVTVNIPSKALRIQTELLALDGAIEAEIERGVQKLEELKERKQQLLALPHLPD
jgi:hypothetical protein|tara:strand:+ start:125 stop:469 length:345 start_codon:yes stop_codon:yes gene_type:complete